MTWRVLSGNNIGDFERKRVYGISWGGLRNGFLHSSSKDEPVIIIIIVSVKPLVFLALYFFGYRVYCLPHSKDALIWVSVVMEAGLRWQREVSDTGKSQFTDPRDLSRVTRANLSLPLFPIELTDPGFLSFVESVAREAVTYMGGGGIQQPHSPFMLLLVTPGRGLYT